MQLLLTNDDGIDAPGLAALQQAATSLGAQFTVVAPRDPMSQVGHRLTTHEPIHVQQRGPKHFAVAAAPADCARVAVRYLRPNSDFLIAGINAGGNLGTDIYPSGTVAAAREATLLGMRAVAVSHYKRRGLDFDWDRAARWTNRVLEILLQQEWERGTFWNINLPHLEPSHPEPEVVECEVCREPLPADFRVEGDYYHYVGAYEKRRRTAGSDVEHCFAGRITLSKLRI